MQVIKKIFKSWARRMGYSPAKSLNYSSNSMSNYVNFPVDVAEWTYEPKKLPKNSQNSNAFNGPIIFRTWDFNGLQVNY